MNDAGEIVGRKYRPRSCWVDDPKRDDPPPKLQPDGQRIMAPPGVSLDKDICQATEMGKGAPHVDPKAAYAASFLVWLHKVRYGGDWDYKTRDPSNVNVQNFGNFAFGATGTAMGIPEDILLAGAGLAQMQHDGSKHDTKRLGVPFLGLLGGSNGDHPEDQDMIRRGIQYAKDHPCK